MRESVREQESESAGDNKKQENERANKGCSVHLFTTLNNLLLSHTLSFQCPR